MATTFANAKGSETDRLAVEISKQSILKKHPRNNQGDSGRELHFADSVDFGSDSESVNVIDDITVVGYRRNRVRLLLVWFLYVLSLGVLRLIFFWKPFW